MLNYETLISSFDDKLTLMQWLKKVEAALGDASLSSIEVTNPTPTTGKIKLNFADGTSVESDEYTLNPAAVDEIYDALVGDSNIVITKENGKVKISFASIIRVNELIALGDVAIQGDVEIGQGHETARVNGNVVVTGDIVQEGEGEINANSIDTNALLVQENANVSGDMTVGGAITGNSIIENMTGYSFGREPSLPQNCVLNYVGIVKNGNKLTFVISVVYTRRSGDPTNLLIGRLYIPSDIYNKLVTNSLGAIDNKTMNCFSATGVYKEVPVRTTKGGNYFLVITFYSMSSLTTDLSYEMRYEATFLLSDNMAA